jgi:hypothetical protein
LALWTCALAARRLQGMLSDTERTAQLVLDELLEHPSRHWSATELERTLDLGRIEIADAAAFLDRNGLAHRDNAFVWPTGAAVQCDRLLRESA